MSNDPGSLEGLSARAADLIAALDGSTGRRVYLRDISRLFDQIDPASRGSTHRRTLLADTLTELANHQRIGLPASASWDRNVQPPLPRFIVLPEQNETATRSKGTIWHPDMAWAADYPLKTSQRQYAEQINTWLHRNRDTTVVPLRERSLEIFGDEKRLDRLITTGLFGPGRLTLATIRTRRAAPRLTTERVGDGHTLLVVENSDTFDSLVTVLTRDPGTIGLIGWGAGGGFEASVLSIPRLNHHIDAIYYYGDLDNRGLQIPARADATARANGLPAVHPAYGLYQALFRVGQPQSGKPRLGDKTVTELVAWLPQDLRGHAARLLASGHRLAQEATGIRHLAHYQGWREMREG